MGQFKVNEAGMLSTFQDRGRIKYQAFGVPISGPMDTYSHQVANLLLDNDPEAAVLEMTLLGGTFLFDTDTVIAITGAEMQAFKNQKEPLACWQTHLIKAGDTLSFGSAVSGCRTYLAVAGGFNLISQLGSRATNIRSGLGGHAGRALQKGDVITYGVLDHPDVLNHTRVLQESKALKDVLKESEQQQEDFNRLIGRFILPDEHPHFEHKVVLRVVMGPQEDAFTDEGIKTFLESSYDITNQSDRMGYRLRGKRIKHVDSADILSDGIVKGAIQIPGHGEPIIMMADCQTTGGYPKIAHVISVDLDKVAQAKAGDQISFKAVTLPVAQALLKEQAEKMAHMARRLKDPISKTFLEENLHNQRLQKQIKQYAVKVSGQTYHVTVEEK